MHWRFVRALRFFLAARSRRAEDELAAAVAAGVGQYVVLGAGLDTFAYRNPHPPDRLRVFEVDHPATQAWKRERLAAAGVEPPASLTYVPVDFETQTLPERLAASGFRMDAPAYFSWLGVTMYLARATVLGTFGFVASRPEGSSITFDYLIPPSSLSLVGRVFMHLRAWRVALAGEPWRSYFAPDELAGELRAMGFTRVQDHSLGDLMRLYWKRDIGPLGERASARVMTAFR
jgi:methyltransferase (TIGR00027 family)